MPLGSLLDRDREAFGSSIHGMTIRYSDVDCVFNMYFQDDADVRVAESVVDWVGTTFNTMMWGRGVLA